MCWWREKSYWKCGQEGRRTREPKGMKEPRPTKESPIRLKRSSGGPPVQEKRLEFIGTGLLSKKTTDPTSTHAQVRFNQEKRKKTNQRYSWFRMHSFLIGAPQIQLEESPKSGADCKSKSQKGIPMMPHHDVLWRWWWRPMTTFLLAGQMKKRQTRITFTPFQVQELEAVFHTNHYPDVNTRDALASRLQLSEGRIQVGFITSIITNMTEGKIKNNVKCLRLFGFVSFWLIAVIFGFLAEYFYQIGCFTVYWCYFLAA